MVNPGGVPGLLAVRWPSAGRLLAVRCSCLIWACAIDPIAPSLSTRPCQRTTIVGSFVCIYLLKIFFLFFSLLFFYLSPLFCVSGFLGSPPSLLLLDGSLRIPPSHTCPESAEDPGGLPVRTFSLRVSEALQVPERTFEIWLTLEKKPVDHGFSAVSPSFLFPSYSTALILRNVLPQHGVPSLECRRRRDCRKTRRR